MTLTKAEGYDKRYELNSKDLRKKQNWIISSQQIVMWTKSSQYFFKNVNPSFFNSNKFKIIIPRWKTLLLTLFLLFYGVKKSYSSRNDIRLMRYATNSTDERNLSSGSLWTKWKKKIFFSKFETDGMKLRIFEDAKINEELFV